MNILVVFDNHLQPWPRRVYRRPLVPDVLDIGMVRTGKKQPSYEYPLIPDHALGSIPQAFLATSQTDPPHWELVADMIRSRLILDDFCFDDTEIQNLLQIAFVPNPADRARIDYSMTDLYYHHDSNYSESDYDDEDDEDESIYYDSDSDSDYDRNFHHQSQLFQNKPPEHINNLVKKTMAFFHKAHHREQDLFVVRVNYETYKGGNAHAMLLVGGLTINNKLWLQIFDSNGIYNNYHHIPLLWVPWFFSSLHGALKTKYSDIKSLEDILETTTHYWVTRSVQIQISDNREIHRTWTKKILKFMMADTRHDIYPNRSQLNNIKKVGTALLAKKEAIETQQKEGHVNLLDETGFDDVDDLVSYLTNQGICRHVASLMKLLIIAVPRENRHDGSTVMKIALNALVGPSTDPNTLIKFQWRRTMAMISWYIWGKLSKAVWNIGLSNYSYTLGEITTTLTNHINTSIQPATANLYKSALPSEIIKFLQPGDILDPSHVTYDTARFLTHRMGVQRIGGKTIKDGDSRGHLTSITWILYNSYSLYRLTNTFQLQIVREFLKTTNTVLMTLITSHSSIPKIMLTRSTTPNTVISIAIRTVGDTLLSVAEYDIPHKYDRTPEKSQTINMVLSSLSDLLFRTTKWTPDKKKHHNELLIRHLRFCVQKIDRYRILTLKMPGLFEKPMANMNHYELETSLTHFYPELSQTNAAPRYLNQRTANTKSAFQDVFENLFARLDKTDPPTPNLKPLQLECLMRWSYAIAQYPIHDSIKQAIQESEIRLLTYQITLQGLLGRHGKTILPWLEKLKSALSTESNRNITNYYAAWEPLSQYIMKAYTQDMVLLQKHVDLATKAGMVLVLDENTKVDLQLSGKPGSLFVFLKQFYMPSFSMLMDFVAITMEPYKKIHQKAEAEEEEEENQ